ncbi:tRNA1(Val) (adenine(37)-N6)-methyltransferase [Paenibacillus pasadenensis]|uniref:tRNA1(Val) (adenine(37)-N6)-methyltransferase n=1 Tax=Paenibacillus pasadenensis TaxID=217090 RepID=UPI002041B51D|nr:tRNA1(Val) (adenine(37)-N6)-methyltransferase [Paenibacillus pasadenensis]MCM3750023.1 tRNA1(Val) (adenine(37)-N6)-methyltransferase [Paenibacillus pasadenensis]
MEHDLLPSERLDDLLTHHLHIIQSREVFSFSMDAVLLARFAAVPKRGKIADLCSGNGVIPLLLSTRTQATIDAVEIQPRLADMARRSVELNGLQSRISVVEGDLREKAKQLGYGKYDYVTVNPPYLPPASGDRNDNAHYAAARHELNGTLDEIVQHCSRLLRTGGKAAMVHRPGRLVEIISSMTRWKLEPKRIRFVHPHAGSEANMVLIEATRDARPSVKLLPPLIVYKDGQQYSDEIMQIYYGGERGDTNAGAEELRGS